MDSSRAPIASRKRAGQVVLERRGEGEAVQPLDAEAGIVRVVDLAEGVPAAALGERKREAIAQFPRGLQAVVSLD